MDTEQQINFERIASAIDYISSNFKLQPGLDEVAAYVHLSPFHFQRLFTQWAGTTPKKFLQYTSIQYARQLLKKEQATLFDAACETGLSGTSRLHDLFVKIEGMTPAEYKNGGANLNIHYSFEGTPFGTVLVASTGKGLCYMAFITNQAQATDKLKAHFPNASLFAKSDAIQQNALGIFKKNWHNLSEIKLHLKGTPFQINVWQALLSIPVGKLTTYGNIAGLIQNNNACRAVGTAIGSNPIAYIIPCHRVIQATGNTGGYMWGAARKKAIIGWEAVQNNAG